jgi:hypothetical protein
MVSHLKKKKRIQLTRAALKITGKGHGQLGTDIVFQKKNGTDVSSSHKKSEGKVRAQIEDARYNSPVRDK